MKSLVLKNGLIALFCLLQYVSIAQPPNNAIFNGGIGDGWHNSSFAVSANSIFLGGSGDGWHNSSFAVAANTIFLGGSGDGWHNNSNNVAANTIFLGGDGDGWHNSSFNPPPNSIFTGGIGDGWHNNNFALPANSIFLGGDGDGWSNVIYPLGALPVTLLSFTGEQQGKTNLLKWITTLEINTSHFELERSNNANTYVTIKSVLAAGTSSTAKNYLAVDEHPFAGNNFYRLKMVDADGKYKYSNIVLLRMINNDVLLSVFPNPTADKLNIAISSSNNTSQFQLSVFDNAGKLLTRQAVTNSNGISYDVSKYPAGIYLLKIFYNDKEETIRFVKSK